MIAPATLLEVFRQQGLRQYFGVPDSLLRSFCDHASADLPTASHVITANEGGAVAMAIGHHLATGDGAVVYMQNSGLGNAVNPLLSLADIAVYSVPMMLLVGWRGEPGRKDEPQHVTQGRVTPELLDAMEIPYAVLDAADDVAEVVDELATKMRSERRPVALVVRAGAFEPPVPRGDAVDDQTSWSRERAIEIVLDELPEDAVVIGTTGHISRELFETRARRGETDPADFLTVGGMGHASSIALAVAMARPERTVVCLDGDGALLMHLGVVPIIASQAPPNLLHVVLNNGVHDSVGGQPTVGLSIDVPGIARASGYPSATSVDDGPALAAAIGAALRSSQLSLVEAKVPPGARADLGRPTSTPAMNRDALLTALGH